MTPLRQRMLEDMQLRGFAARTQEAYLHAVSQLAQHFGKSRGKLSEGQLHEYFLRLVNVKKVARATHTIALCGIKFCFERTLGRTWSTFELVRPPRQRELPVVLSHQEVCRILACVRVPVYRLCLTTIYACGLRLIEGTRLQVQEIDSARMVLHIHGKAGACRSVSLPQELLMQLRALWLTLRALQWVFRSPPRRGIAKTDSPKPLPLDRSCLQSAFKRALKRSGIGMPAHVHTLRHSYATHLLVVESRYA